MRQFFILFAVLFFSFSAGAQKKEISEARSSIKSRSNLEQAEASMRELLKDSANRGNIKIYQTLADAVRAQYEVINEKLYLKEQFDTASLFTTARKMFLTYECLDSADMRPDKKGRVKPEFRKKNSEFLAKYRRNLYNGGMFFIKKHEFDKAYSMMDVYLDCKRQPLFTGYEFNDSISSLAAFWTVYSGHKLSRPDSTLKYSGLALSGKKYRRRTLAYMAGAYLQKGDTLTYVNTLRQGFNENKTSRFFFTRLMDYYNNSGKLDSAMVIVNSALEADEDNILFLFAKSNTLLNLGDYKGCISISDELIARNDTLADVYLNAGVSYINMALALEKDLKNRRKNSTVILEYYKKAMPYMEKYRALAPDDKARWAPSLYNIYLKLNMGKKFEEISGVLKKMRK